METPREGTPAPDDPTPEEHDGQDGQDSQEGQVSEVGNLDDAGEPIFPGDAVAGHPLHGEGGSDVQEGAAGPNARTGDEELDQ
ncbi:MAG TPA: hypothetical protein VNT31_14000 [Nocardioides sp.]|nr:hypothetical protein [Nocardioides sp.]